MVWQLSTVGELKLTQSTYKKGIIMSGNTFQKQRDYYLKNRSPVNAKCILPATEPDKEIIFCSRLIITNEPECYCVACINPDAKWRNGDCNLADTALRTVETFAEQKVRVGQQKHSRKKKSRR